MSHFPCNVHQKDCTELKEYKTANPAKILPLSGFGYVTIHETRPCKDKLILSQVVVDTEDRTDNDVSEIQPDPADKQLADMSLHADTTRKPSFKPEHYQALEALFARKNPGIENLDFHY